MNDWVNKIQNVITNFKARKDETNIQATSTPVTTPNTNRPDPAVFKQVTNNNISLMPPITAKLFRCFMLLIISGKADKHYP